jgi:hypothetical protein
MSEGEKFLKEFTQVDEIKFNKLEEKFKVEEKLKKFIRKKFN